MQDGPSLPFVCTAKHPISPYCFACLSDLLTLPHLQDEEKLLWIWLANQCAKQLSFTCSFNYVQISQAMCKSSRKIHRILTRLRVMGFLIADLPIEYGKLTVEMVQKIYTFKLVLPPRVLFEKERV